VKGGGWSHRSAVLNMALPSSHPRVLNPASGPTDFMGPRTAGSECFQGHLPKYSELPKAHLKKALMMNSRARSSTGKEKCCLVSGIWRVGFFVLKNEWNKQNLGKASSIHFARPLSLNGSTGRGSKPRGMVWTPSCTQLGLSWGVRTRVLPQSQI
jgi:hypothetical protein